MRRTQELLQELSNSISFVYDLDLAEEMTNISIDLSNNSEMSDRYWSLVRKFAIVEKERDELRAQSKKEET